MKKINREQIECVCLPPLVVPDVLPPRLKTQGTQIHKSVSLAYRLSSLEPHATVHHFPT